MAVPLLSWALKVLFYAGLVRADEANLFRSEGYANGFDGNWPVQSFRSAGVFGPILNYWQDSPACKDGQYTILAPRGDSVRRPGPMILDEEGHLVWFKDYPTTYNANVYLYKGESYLTFWAGDDSIRGHGDGTYYMVRSTQTVSHAFEHVQKRRRLNSLYRANNVRSTLIMKSLTRFAVQTVFPPIYTIFT